ncbi:MAG: EAL domain-containing protein [Geminicoccales bacterium]
MVNSLDKNIENDRVVIHRNAKPLFVSESWAALHGYTKTEILRMPSLEPLRHPDDRAKLVSHAVDRTAGRYAPRRIDYRAVRMDGTLIWVDVLVRTVEWQQQPAIMCKIVGARDISEMPIGQRRATPTDPAMLRLLSVIDQLPDGYALFDADERLMIWNQRYVALTPQFRRPCQSGDQFETLIRASVDYRVIEDAIGREEAWLNQRLQAFRSPDNQSMEIRYGQRIVQARHIKTNDGGTLLIVTDVTETRRAEADLRNYASALEQVKDLVAIIDKDYRFLFINDAMVHFYRKPKTDLLGRHLAEIIGEEQFYGTSKKELDHCFAGKSLHAHRRQINGDGETRHFDVDLEPFRSGHDDIVGAIVVLRDVTDATKRARELQVTQSAINQIAERVLIFDKHERIRFLNQRNLDFFGRTIDQVIGMSVDDLLGWGDVDDGVVADCKVKNDIVLTRGTPARLEYWRAGNDGVPRYWETSIVPYREADSTISGAIATTRDMTEHREAKRTKERFQDAIEHLADGYALFDKDERLVACNRIYYLKQSKLMPDFALGVSFETIIKARVSSGSIADAIGQEEAWLVERLRNFRAELDVADFQESNGRWTHVRNRRTADGGTLLVVTDITEKKKIEEALAESQSRFKDFTELAADWFWEQDAKGRYIYVSESIETLTKRPVKELLGKDPTEVFGHNVFNDPQWSSLRHEFLTTGIDRIVEIEHDMSAVDGQVYRVISTIRPIKNAAGAIIGYRGAAKDITAAHRLEKQLEYQANHDALTGLPNRRSFERHLDQAIKAGTSGNRPAVLCFIDLDQFKIVNDTAGHLAGDRLLRQVADLLSSKLRDSDILARLGGDEFGLLLHDCSLRRAKNMAERLLAFLNEDRFLHDDTVFEIGASIGLTIIDGSGSSIDDIMAEADLACYAAKDDGRNRVEVYQARDQELALRRDEMSKASLISWALDFDRFVLFAQPIIPLTNSSSGEIGFEILLRMNRQDDSLMMPNAFIPSAERYGLMTKIDYWVIENSFAAFPAIRANHPNARMSINLSGVSLNEVGLAAVIERLIKSYEIEPQHVCFEITETAAIRSFARTKALIMKLKKIGCRFALDDFGSGLSSFSYLKQLPVDYLKIDGAFIRDIDQDKRSRTMVEAIHHVAKSLDLLTVAECIETEKTAKTLRHIGVDFAQGIAVGRPEPLTNWTVLRKEAV